MYMGMAHMKLELRLHVAVSVGVVISQLLIDLVDEVVHLDGVVVIVLGGHTYMTSAERGMDGGAQLLAKGRAVA